MGHSGSRKAVLGKYLVRKLGEEMMIGIIVDVEAYKGMEDSTSYAYRWLTSRSKLMFKHGGLAYIVPVHAYLCFNVTTERRGIPGAVLIQAIELIQGFEIFKNILEKENVEAINGPGKLTRALKITHELNGLDLTKCKALFLCYSRIQEKFRTFYDTRIGVKMGKIGHGDSILKKKLSLQKIMLHVR